jgi:ABC-type sugar transport system ATPase subunit/ribose/xylose/arabinose/galactoside ABC-type transport system permease subunit
MTTTSSTLGVRGVSVAFGGVDVLKDVSLSIRAGEIHGLVGENGAGKSTLLKVFGGVHRPRKGSIEIDGKPCHLPSPHASIAHGIALIHQEPLGFPDLTVAENICLGQHPTKGVLRRIDWKAMEAKAARALVSLGLNIDPGARMRALSIADRQMVQIASALAQNARVLLMDEATAALTPSEVAELFAIMERLRDDGKTLVFISHRFEEVFQICDCVSVLRDGEMIAAGITTETPVDDVISMMVGRPLSALFEREERPATGDPLLEVEMLSRAGKFEDISFCVRQGEIVGLAGLVGAGRTDVARALFGVTKADSGSVRIGGRDERISSPRKAIAAGVALVPEDRQQHGLLLPMSIAQNMSLAVLGRIASWGWLPPRKEKVIAAEYVKQLQLACRNVEQPATELSGGNQQKVVLSKWLLTEPRVIILDEPTKGIDIGAKIEVHRLMGKLVAQGAAILMISSDLPEVLAMSDRILVMRQGKIAGEFDGDGATPEKVMAAATGQDQNAGSPQKNIDATVQAQSRLSRFSNKIVLFREFGILGLLVLIVAGAAILEPRFLSGMNFRSILLWFPILAVVAMGEMMVIISRGIDVSIGSIMGFSGIVVGMIFRDHPEFNIYLGTCIGIGLGAMLGSVNGGLIAWAKVPPIIATLGTLSVYRGLVFIVSGGRQIDPNHVPRELIQWSQAGPFGVRQVPWLVFIALVIAVLTFYFLRYTTTGRTIYALGGNPLAAEMRWLPIKCTNFLIYLLAGAAAGLGGVLYASRYGFVNPAQTGVGFELTVIAAVVIGGTNIFGGSGSVVGVLLGCVLLATISVALAVLGIAGTWQLAVYGFIILLTVVIDHVIHSGLNRASAGA